jgi:glycosidase
VSLLKRLCNFQWLEAFVQRIRIASPKRYRRVTFLAFATVAIFVSGLRLHGVSVRADSPVTKANVAPAYPTAIAESHSYGSHLFRYTPDAGATITNANVAGDFNGWSSTQTPMRKLGDHYEADVKLTEGVHYYKFVIDGKWLNDPQSDPELEVTDSYGGKNSGVLVGLDARKLPAPAADRINAASVAFDPTDVRDCNVVSSQMIRLSIRAQAGDVASASVLIQSAGGWDETSLGKVETRMGLDRFGGVILPGKPPADPVLHYVFKFSKPGVNLFIANGQAYTDESSAETAAYSTPMQTDFETPDWAKHAVWYQIFPERFRNGDPSNDPDKVEKWTSKWFDTHPGETGKFYNDVWSRRYGGDIQGIRQELPYLRKLGITAIYLNPIFQAWDLHKYDTTDYRHVDEHFGVKGDIEQLQGETDDPATWQWTASDKIFLDFLAEAHRQGFHVIIDGVFNHVGRRFWAFQDVIKNGRDSKYADWFDITDWTPGENAPFHYHAWDGDNGALPAFKKDSQLGIVHGPREHIFAITKRWLAPDGDPSKGVDGIRLDAPEGIAHPFWVEWRNLVKTTKPDAYISGEIWGWAQSYLSGGEYDGVMNYRFAELSQKAFVNQKTALSISELNSGASQLIFNYPFQAALVNQNLFDSHDTDRVASMFVNPDLPFDGADRIEDNGPHYNPAKPNDQQRARMMQEVSWQMTFVGAPMIYYGDEAGMWSPDDPSNRQPMIWKDLEPYDDPEVKFDQEKFDWYQRLIATRNHLPALQTGFFHPVKIDDAKNIFVYSRDLGDQHAYVVINRSSESAAVTFAPTENASRFVNWLDPAAVSISRVVDGSTDRPEAAIADARRVLEPEHHKLTVHLRAWGSAVITAAP